MPFEIDDERSPLENFQDFMSQLESVHDSVPADTDPEVVQFIVAISSFSANLLDSVRQFQTQGQVSTIDVFDSYVPVEAKNRAAFLQNSISEAALQMALLKSISNLVITYIRRIKEIVGVIPEFELHGSAATYVREMAELYLLGRDLAVFMMARSALDETLQGVIEKSADTPFREWRHKRNVSGRGTLDDRILFARHYGLLNATLAQQADQIRISGNNAVHDQGAHAQNHPSAGGIIKSVAATLRALSR